VDFCFIVNRKAPKQDFQRCQRTEDEKNNIFFPSPVQEENIHQAPS